MDNLHEYDIESESLQADVMRFLAIIAFSLLVIFIPLIQVVSQQSPKEDKSRIQVEEKSSKPVTEVKKDKKQEDIDKKDKTYRGKESDHTGQNEQKPDYKEEKQKNVESQEPDAKRVKKIAFRDKAFQTLLTNNKIRGYVILLEDNLSFEFLSENGNFEFRKSEPPENVLGLRRSTLPKDLLNAFSDRYPSLATRKKEFYFKPSSKLKNALKLLKKSEEHGVFHITSQEEIIHAD